MQVSPSLVADAFAPVTLAELERSAQLQDRVDVKYVVPVAVLAQLAERLRATHSVLEIGGRRAFRYHTTYFDTDELSAYRDHQQGRRRRYKCRSRVYLDSGACVLEVKLKGPRGRTVKHRMPYDPGRPAELSGPAEGFVRACLERSYGASPAGALRPALAVRYTRMTFASLELGERVTCDFDLAFSSPDGTSGRLASDMVIVESKSVNGNAAADRELRLLGARPERDCSKYCLGVGFTHPEVKSNRLRPVLRRHFRAAPAAAVAFGRAAAGAPAATAAVPQVDLRAAKQIRDDPKVPAKLRVGGRTYRVEVEFRGHSSLQFPKKSLAVETDKPVRLLGLPRERDWVLNAMYADSTLMRDAVAHRTAQRLGLSASRTRYVTLRLNRRAAGVYLLMEQPELSDRRVRGEALVEFTQRAKVDRGDAWFPSRVPDYAIVHAEPDEPDDKDARAVRRAVTALEGALAGPGWRSLLDERSAVDYVLHAELFKNVDAFLASTYVHLREDGRLALGPVWDLDRSMGNAGDPALAAADGSFLAGRPWAGPLLADPAFRASLAARWRELRGRGLVEAVLADVDRRARTLARPAAGNFARWPVLTTPVFPGQPVFATHADAVAGLRGWLAQRAAWMDAAYAG